MTRRELLNVFERHGIKRVDPMGEKFDPHFHQAMFEVPTNEQPPGTVMQVMQAGFKIGDRVLAAGAGRRRQGGVTTSPPAPAFARYTFTHAMTDP